MKPRHANPRINGDRLRVLRQEAGLTVADLARKIGCTANYISAIERGQRPTVSPAMFNRICAAMGVRRSELTLDNIESVA